MDCAVQLDQALGKGHMFMADYNRDQSHNQCISLLCLYVTISADCDGMLLL